MSKRKVVFRVPITKEVSKKTKIPIEEMNFIYDVMMETIYNKIKDGYDVVLPNIGRISLYHTKERFSNWTGQKVPPHKRLGFKANVELARFIRVSTREYPINQSKT